MPGWRPCRGVGVVIMDVNDFPLCLGISLPSSISQFLLQALRPFLTLVFHTAMMCISQVYLGRGFCIVFQKDTFAFGVGVMVWSPKVFKCAGICGRAMCRDWWSFFYYRREET